MKVLFVCLGNICRSPAAEGAFLEELTVAGLINDIKVDSAGTSNCHAGELADERMREHAKKRGINLVTRSRQFVAKDFEIFDYIIVMDESNYENVLKVDVNNQYKEKVFRMLEFTTSFSETEVPDPYWGGEEGFERVLDIVTEASKGLLREILKKIK